MLVLIIISCVWALAFGLVKYNLTGINPITAACIRSLVSLICFLPFIKINKKFNKTHLFIMLIGAIQFGIMYIFVISAYSYLKAYQVAMLTAFTPIYVVFIDKIINKSLNIRVLIAALIATFGATLLYLQPNSEQYALKGFILVQLADICFALGQMLYRNIKVENDLSVFGLAYVGSSLVTLLFALPNGFIEHLHQITTRQWLVLGYLGFASGFANYLWNVTAKKTKVGVIAVMNNLKMPLGVLFSIVIFNETADLIKLFASITFIGLAITIATKQKTN